MTVILNSLKIFLEELFILYFIKKNSINICNNHHRHSWLQLVSPPSPASPSPPLYHTTSISPPLYHYPYITTPISPPLYYHPYITTSISPPLYHHPYITTPILPPLYHHHFSSTPTSATTTIHRCGSKTDG